MPAWCPCEECTDLDAIGDESVICDPEDAERVLSEWFRALPDELQEACLAAYA